MRLLGILPNIKHTYAECLSIIAEKITGVWGGGIEYDAVVAKTFGKGLNSHGDFKWRQFQRGFICIDLCLVVL